MSSSQEQIVRALSDIKEILLKLIGQSKLNTNHSSILPTVKKQPPSAPIVKKPTSQPTTMSRQTTQHTPITMSNAQPPPSNPCDMPFGANNICNVNADNIQSGTFVGKRDIQKNKRQWIGNTANVNAGTIGGGNFI